MMLIGAVVFAPTTTYGMPAKFDIRTLPIDILGRITMFNKDQATDNFNFLLSGIISDPDEEKMILRNELKSNVKTSGRRDIVRLFRHEGLRILQKRMNINGLQRARGL